MSKRILQCVTGNFSVAGLSRIVTTWGDALQSDGYTFDYLCRIAETPADHDISRKLEDSGSIVSYPDRGSYFQRQKNLLKTHAYPVVHVHSDTSYNLMRGALIPKRQGVQKVILHAHSSGLDVPSRISKWPRYIVKRLAHALCRPLLRLEATDFCSCSEEATKWMYPASLHARVTMIHNAVDTAAFRFSEKDREEVRAGHALGNKKVVGHIGRFSYQKNQKFILELAEKMKQSHPEVQFVLIGEGELFKEIERGVKEKNLKNVLLTGRSDEVPRWMQAFDLLILPSHYEGLPVVGVEAQAAGLPCLFSESVDRAAGILETTDFLPLQLEVWENAISHTAVAKDREAAAGIVEVSAFGLERCKIELMQLYS